MAARSCLSNLQVLDVEEKTDRYMRLVYVMLAMVAGACSHSDQGNNLYSSAGNNTTLQYFQQQRSVAIESYAVSARQELNIRYLDQLANAASLNDIREILGVEALPAAARDTLYSTGEPLVSPKSVQYAPSESYNLLFSCKQNEDGIAVKLTGRFSPWATREGISLGTPMRRLEKINQAPFQIIILNSKSVGRVKLDRGILTDRGLTIYLDADTPEKLPSAFINDSLLYSHTATARELDLVVSGIVLN